MRRDVRRLLEAGLAVPDKLQSIAAEAERYFR